MDRGAYGLLSCCGVWASYCGDFSGYGTEALGCMGFISYGSWDLEQGLNNCVSWAWLFTVCGIILDQGLNQCLLHWLADSLPLSHQGNSTCASF